MAKGYQSGHRIIYNGEWLYADTMTSIDIPRPCVRCGRLPTKEGYDACLGHIEGATSACCGHGVHSPIIIKERTMEKKSIQDVAEIVEMEGLGYAVSDYLGADSIDNPELAEQWRIAKEALTAIEKIIEPYMED